MLIDNSSECLPSISYYKIRNIAKQYNLKTTTAAIPNIIDFKTKNELPLTYALDQPFITQHSTHQYKHRKRINVLGPPQTKTANLKLLRPRFNVEIKTILQAAKDLGISPNQTYLFW